MQDSLPNPLARVDILYPPLYFSYFLLMCTFNYVEMVIAFSSLAKVIGPRKRPDDAIFPFVNGRCHLEQSLSFLKQSLPFQSTRVVTQT